MTVDISVNSDNSTCFTQHQHYAEKVLYVLSPFWDKVIKHHTGKSNKPKWKSDKTAMINWTDYKSQRTVIKWTHNKMTIRKMKAINQKTKTRKGKFVKVSEVICRKWLTKSGSFSNRTGVLLRRRALLSTLSIVKQLVTDKLRAKFFDMIGVKLQQRTKLMFHHQALQSGHRADGVVSISTTLQGQGAWTGASSVSLCGEKASLRSLPQLPRYWYNTPVCSPNTGHCWQHHHHNLTRVEVQPFLSDKVNDRQTWLCHDR